MRNVHLVAAALSIVALAACSDSGDPTSLAAVPQPEYQVLRGAKLARDVCGQCHSELTGSTLGTPVRSHLCEVQDYTLEEFTRLLTLGVTREDSAVAWRMNIVTESLSEEDHALLLAYLQHTLTKAP